MNLSYFKTSVPLKPEYAMPLVCLAGLHKYEKCLLDFKNIYIDVSQFANYG